MRRAQVMIDKNKCVSCGSHEYIRASGTIICSYCRVPKDGITVRENSAGNQCSEMYMNGLEVIWGAGLMRPDVVVRIAKDGEQ